MAQHSGTEEIKDSSIPLIQHQHSNKCCAVCQTAQITVLAELCDGTDVAVMLVPAVLLNRHLWDRPRPRSRVKRNHFGPGDLPRDAQLSGDVCMSASNTLIPKVLVLAYPKMVMPLSRSSPLELDSIGSDEG